MQAVVWGAGPFVEVGVFVVVACLCGDGSDICYESEEESVNGRHDVFKRLQQRLCGVTEKSEGRGTETQEREDTYLIPTTCLTISRTIKNRGRRRDGSGDTSHTSMPAAALLPVPKTVTTGQKDHSKVGVGPAFRLVQVETLWQKGKGRSVDASVGRIHDSALSALRRDGGGVTGARRQGPTWSSLRVE